MNKHIEDDDSVEKTKLKPMWYLFDVKQLRVYRTDPLSNTITFKADDEKRTYKYQNNKLNLLINENKYLSKVYNVIVKENSQEVVYWDYFNPIDVDIFKTSFNGTYYMNQIDLENRKDKCYLKFELNNNVFNYVLNINLKEDRIYKRIHNQDGVLTFS